MSEWEQIEQEIRSEKISDLMLTYGFRVARNMRKCPIYLKRIGDIELILAIQALENHLPESWDEGVSLAFLEYWTDETDSNFLYPGKPNRHFSLNGKAVIIIPLAISFQTEEEILRWLKMNGPNMGKIPVGS